MRLGWTTGKYSTTYRAIKTVRINGKNKTQIVRSFGSEKHICKTYDVTDAGLSSATNRVFKCLWKILSQVKQFIDASNVIVGEYMCQSRK